MDRPGRLFLGCLLGLLLLAAPASEANEDATLLHDVERLRSNPTNRDAAWVALRFAADEPFRFMVEERLANLEAGQGTLLLWDHDADASTPDQRFVVEPGVIEVRAALLAARAFWDAACAGERLEQRFARRGPMTIWIADEVAEDGTHAVSRYSMHHMLFYKDHLDAETAVHEYFHMVQGALWAEGDARRWEERHGKGLFAFLSECTATWAQDVPLRVQVASGRIVEPDRENSYLSAVGQFWRLSDYSLLRRREDPSARGMDGYIEALFVKYLAEQLAGGKDPGNTGAVLRWFARCMQGELTATELVRRTGEALPASLGLSWQARWRAFHKAFRMSNVVQRGGAAPEHASLLGYFDDAFQSFEGKPKRYHLDDDGLMYPVYLGPDGVCRSAYARPPQALETEPAKDDDERARRLAALLQPEVLVPQGCRTRLIALAPRLLGAKPFERIAYVMVEADGPADAYLLEQRTRDDDHRGRETASFRWLQDLAVPEEGDARRSLVRVTLRPAVGEQAFLWCGLVNQDLEDRTARARWTYVNVPRLVPIMRPNEHGRASATVELIGGSAFERAPREGMRNGDDFVLSFDTTGPIHFGAPTREAVPPRELMLKAELIGADGKAVGLDGPLRFDALAPPGAGDDGRVRYTLSGRLAENNPVAGACRLRLRVESLLRLDEADVQRDESFAFTIARGPRVARVRVTSGEHLAYDSDEPLRSPGAKTSDAGLAAVVEVEFTEAMDPATLAVVAGGDEPHDRWPVTGVTWTDARTCRGVLKVAKADLPEHGLLRFSIQGSSGEGVALDADVMRAGAQPDTRHSVLVDVPETYRVMLEMSGRCDLGHATIEVEPLRVEHVLVRGEPSVTQSYLLRQGRRILRDIQKRAEQVAARLVRERREIAALREGGGPSVATVRQRLAVQLATRRELIDELEAGRAAGFDRLMAVEHLALAEDAAILDREPTKAGLLELGERVVRRVETEHDLLEAEMATMHRLLRVLGASKIYEAEATRIAGFRFDGARRAGEALPGRPTGERLDAMARPLGLADLPEGSVQGNGRVRLRVLQAAKEDLEGLAAFLEAGPYSPLRTNGFVAFVADELWAYMPAAARPSLESLTESPRFPDLGDGHPVHLSWSRSFLRFALPATHRRIRVVGQETEIENGEGILHVQLHGGMGAHFAVERTPGKARLSPGGPDGTTTQSHPTAFPPHVLEDGTIEVVARPTARTWGGVRFTTNEIPDPRGGPPATGETTLRYQVEQLGGDEATAPADEQGAR